MAATKTTAPTAPEYDFDSWDDAAEEKALAALAPDVKYIVVERDFVGRFADGTIVKLPLTITLDDIDALSEAHENPVDQVKVLLERIGGADSVADFTRQNMADTIAMTQKFFAVFARIAGASTPES